MEDWQRTVLWILVFLEALAVLMNLHKTSKGKYCEERTPTEHALIAVMALLFLLFYLTLL